MFPFKQYSTGIKNLQVCCGCAVIYRYFCCCYVVWLQHFQIKRCQMQHDGCFKRVKAQFKIVVGFSFHFYWCGKAHTLGIVTYLFVFI